jgi:hypothetical protein
MTSRRTAFVALALTPVTVLALSSCGGSSSGKDDEPAKVLDRSSFVPITTQGMAAVVDQHLGKAVQGYYAFKDEVGTSGKERSLGVRLHGADARDTFLITVFPSGGSGGQVTPGPCPDGEQQQDPMAKVTCFPAAGAGNVTLTAFGQGFADGNTLGSYLEASGTGPKAREATAAYESFTAKRPISDKQLSAILGDPYLGWETAAKINEAGASLKVVLEE